MTHMRLCMSTWPKQFQHSSAVQPVRSRALEASGLEIKTFIKRFDKERTGFGQGAQIGKSSSRALEAPRLHINVFRKIIYKEKVGFG